MRAVASPRPSRLEQYVGPAAVRACSISIHPYSISISHIYPRGPGYAEEGVEYRRRRGRGPVWVWRCGMLPAAGRHLLVGGIVR
eukprot:scaffold14424_cov105-Isochrysis_galbana.AAC.4